jgi:hypothetical protein
MADFPEDMGSLLQRSQQQKSGETRMWDLCLKFLEGRQWLTYDRNLAQHVTNKSSQNGGTKATVNLLLNVYRNILAKLRLSYPGIVVLPASPSTEDITKAKASETALRYFWEQAQVKEVLGKVIEWLITCGTAAIHTYYDPEKEKIIAKPVGPYDLFFEPDVLSVDESQWVAIRTYEVKEELAEIYPDFADEIEGSGVSQRENNQDAPDSRVELFEIYWRDGKHALFVGDTYIYQDDAYPIREFPVHVFKYTNIPYRLWGLSLLTPLIDLQWLYNKSRSQILNNVELMANPKWLIPKTAGVSKNSITNRPGEKVFYNAAGGKPHQIQSVPMPGYVMDNIQRLQVELLDVSGVHNISLGKREIGVTSGKAINALAQQDSSQLQVTQLSIEVGVQQMAKTALLLMKTYYTEPKMVRMMDSLGQVIFDQIEQASIVDDPEIFLQAGSLFRDEAQDRDAKILQMAEMGLIEKEDAIQELSFRTGNAFITERIASIAHARDILEACKRGYEVEIFRSDDIEAFVKVFGEFMRTRDYYALPMEIQDYIRDVFLSVSTANLPEEEYSAAMRMDKVFPRKPAPNTTDARKASLAIAPESSAAQTQVAGELAEQSAQMGAINQAGQAPDPAAAAALAQMLQGGGQ